MEKQLVHSTEVPANNHPDHPMPAQYSTRANAYPRLVEALRELAARAVVFGGSTEQQLKAYAAFETARALLRELGEAE